jgi:hypothetical protein
MCAASMKPLTPQFHRHQSTMLCLQEKQQGLMTNFGAKNKARMPYSHKAAITRYLHCIFDPDQTSQRVGLKRQKNHHFCLISEHSDDLI